MSCVKGEFIRCVRCLGRKKLFTMNGGYSHMNTGGTQVDCPMCLGSGVVRTFEKALEDATMANRKHKTERLKNKDINATESTEGAEKT